jgi:hypothetical protein
VFPFVEPLLAGLVLAVLATDFETLFLALLAITTSFYLLISKVLYKYLTVIPAE